ncbi:hypothetical protein A6A40_24500 (plasmid) [Azospirillum humicireducens]|uniref:Uncharacterized protein n=1 Tax=Azospirillum humicireducens TaxID=1226968 RepID=A0A2R4VUS1_9PROT|nr:hypothetical protein [Azospirillum humicireducens]AWB08189.1 hypothetical protein A6A40_24500 [Azospirillum humicireducens]
MSVEQYKGYTFRYVQDNKAPGKIKVYVEQQPSYGNRDTSVSIIHRWSGENGSPPYICFKDEYKPSTLANAQRLARGWADKTDVYIRTGVSISDQISR